MKLKSFYDALSGIATDFEKTFEKKAVDADGDQAFRDAEKVGTDDQTTATDEARNQGEFGKQPKWKDVKDLEDKAGETIPKVTQAGKFVWLKLLGGIAVVGVVFTHLSHWSPEDSSRVAEQRIQQSFNSYRVNEDQFNIMVGSLAFPTPVPAPAPMPMAVAEAASEPVEVEITTSSGETRTFTSTVRQVYQSVPAARQEIEHGYDHPDPHSCVATDCLHVHKEFTVDSPIGSASFSTWR